MAKELPQLDGRFELLNDRFSMTDAELAALRAATQEPTTPAVQARPTPSGDGFDNVKSILPEKLGFTPYVPEEPPRATRSKGKGTAVVTPIPRKLTNKAGSAVTAFIKRLPDAEKIFRNYPPGRGRPYAIRRTAWSGFVDRLRLEYDAAQTPDGRVELVRRAPEVPSFQTEAAGASGGGVVA